MEKIGIFYGTTSGNTESIAKQLQRSFGAEQATLFNVTEASAADLETFSNLILGASTWGIGDLQDDFDDFLKVLESANLEGKKVALFGCGDQESYPDSFVDAIGIIYEAIVDKGCTIVGTISTEGYSYDASKAEIDGKLMGLPIDEENQYSLTGARIKSWSEQLSNEFQ